MIALKLVFQSLAGVAAVGSVASGGYYMFNLGEDQYYLVSSTVETTNVASEDNFFSDTQVKTPGVTGLPSSSLFLTTVAGEGEGSPAAKAETSSLPAEQETSHPTPPAQETSSVEEKTTTQNYTCTNKEKKTEDKECKLFTIKFDETNKSIDLSTINTFIKDQVDGKTKDSEKITKTLKKSELTSKHFFILKASTSLITPKMVELKKTITLASTAIDSTDKDKSYATLTLVAQFKEEKVIGKTNLAVVKATSVNDSNATFTNVSDSTKTYTCTLQNADKTDLKGCSIKVLDNYLDSTPFNFSSITLPLTSDSLTITKDKHYLIKWTEAQKFSHLEKDIYFDIKPAQPETAPLQGTTTTPPKQTILSPISRIIAYPTTTSPFTEVIIINK